MAKQVLTATALALLIGASTFTLNAALAQNGGEARSNDRQIQKKLDDRELTPIRPIRRVGDDSWPTAKNRPATRETTGQTEQDEASNDTPAAQDSVKDSAKQEPSRQDAAKPQPPKQDTAKSDAKPDAKPQDTAQAKDHAKDHAKDQAKDQAKDAVKQDAAKEATNETNKNNKKGFASIRLGTDENGRVAVNEAQERQIAKVLRTQHADTVNIKVSVGSVVPADAKLTMASPDLIDIFPQFRGDAFFATADDVVVVDPSSKKVIALIPVKSAATASRPHEEHTTTQARAPSPDHKAARKTAVTRTAVKEKAHKERDVTVGSRARDDDGIPTEAEILSAPVARGRPGTVVTRSYRYQPRYEPYDDYDDDVVVIERPRPRFFPFW